MLIEDYFRQITAVINKCIAVQSSSVTYDKRSSYVGFIRGSIWFSDRSVLHLREFVNVQHGIEHYMYAYQYQNSEDTMIFRYDNTPHFPNLKTFPHHKHDGSESDVTDAEPPDIQKILNEIQYIISGKISV